jgi:hypothetical protein
MSGSFVLTEAFPDIKLNNKINLIKFRASLGEVGKGLLHILLIHTLLKQMLLMVWTANCVSFNGNAGYSL